MVFPQIEQSMMTLHYPDGQNEQVSLYPLFMRLYVSQEDIDPLPARHLEYAPCLT
jgi:hypothetical protein